MTICKETALNYLSEYKYIMDAFHYDHATAIKHLISPLDTSFSSMERYIREGKRILNGEEILTKMSELIKSEIAKDSYNSFPILVIPDLHIPFQHKNALKFCTEIRDKYNCQTIVNVGDEIDCHALSFHTPELDALTADQEYELAKAELALWFKEFPHVKLCIGNHSKIPVRRAKEWGLPKKYLRSFHELWEAPETWNVDTSFVISGVHFSHAGKAGFAGSINSAITNRMSSVFGHNHSFGGVLYQANENSVIFGANAGCLIDVDAYAFAYGKDFPNKPTLGCVVVHSPIHAEFIPMNTDEK